MLTMNAFEPLLKSAGMATERIKALFDQFQETKLRPAIRLEADWQRERKKERRPRSLIRLSEPPCASTIAMAIGNPIPVEVLCGGKIGIAIHLHSVRRSFKLAPADKGIHIFVFQLG
jgi:hypothetical protein